MGLPFPKLTAGQCRGQRPHIKEGAPKDTGDAPDTQPAVPRSPDHCSLSWEGVPSYTFHPASAFTPQIKRKKIIWLCHLFSREGVIAGDRFEGQ